MPDIGWDTTKEIETTVTTKKTQETSETNTTVHILPEARVARVILILTFLETTIPYIQKIPKNCRKIAQVVIKVTGTTSHNLTASLHRITHSKNTGNGTAKCFKQKINNRYNRSYYSYQATTPSDNYDR